MSLLNNPGKIGGGGILRYHQGNVIYAFTTPFGFGTNKQAKIQAANHGLHWCIQHGYKKIHLEVDSELVIKCLSNQAKPPWELQQYTLELHRLMFKLKQFKYTHS